MTKGGAHIKGSTFCFCISYEFPHYSVVFRTGRTLRPQ